MAEALQRSAISFRRQGSSGLVWDDKQLVNGEFVTKDAGEAAPAVGLERSRSTGSRPYRTVKVPSPAADPPSPKVAGCGFCGMFGKPVQQHPRKANRRR